MEARDLPSPLHVTVDDGGGFAPIVVSLIRHSSISRCASAAALSAPAAFSCYPRARELCECDGDLLR